MNKLGNFPSQILSSVCVSKDCYVYTNVTKNEKIDAGGCVNFRSLKYFVNLIKDSNLIFIQDFVNFNQSLVGSLFTKLLQFRSSEKYLWNLKKFLYPFPFKRNQLLWNCSFSSEKMSNFYWIFRLNTMFSVNFDLTK